MTENEALEALKLEGGLEISGKPLRVAQFFEGLGIAIKALEEIQQYRSIGTVEEFKVLKEIDEDLRLKFCYEDLSSAENRGYMQGYNKAIDDFANFLHEKAKENNGLRLSSETRSWTHASIYDYANEFREQLNGGVE